LDFFFPHLWNYNYFRHLIYSNPPPSNFHLCWEQLIKIPQIIPKSHLESMVFT
jgi:hypothetical protein